MKPGSAIIIIPIKPIMTASVWFGNFCKTHFRMFEKIINPDKDPKAKTPIIIRRRFVKGSEKELKFKNTASEITKNNALTASTKRRL